MPRRRTGRRVAPVQARTTVDTVDLSPVLDPDPLDIRVSLASIVHMLQLGSEQRRPASRQCSPRGGNVLHRLLG